MKKYIYSLMFLLSLIFGTSAYSQNLSIVGADFVEKSTDILSEWEIQVLASVKNMSLDQKELKLKIDVLEMPVGHSFGACWAGGCLSSSIISWTSGTTVVLPSLSVMPDYTFVGHYYCMYDNNTCTPGQGKFRYTFFDVNNPSDSTSLVAVLNFTSGNGITEGLSSSGIEVKYLKGNILQINPEETGNYEYIINTLNGTTIARNSFNGEINLNLANYPAGAYLYSIISNDGKVLAKGKMLVN